MAVPPGVLHSAVNPERHSGPGKSAASQTSDSGRIALFARNKLKLTSSAARWLCHLCNQPDSGSVGLCVQVVEYATMLAETRGLSGVDQPLLAEALRCGVTHQRADLLIQEIEQEPPRLVAAAG